MWGAPVSYTHLESLDEAAEIDGANKFTTYFRIIFPMMKPMHATTMIINALWFWNEDVYKRQQ